MKHAQAVAALSALAHAHWLRVFRLLVGVGRRCAAGSREWLMPVTESFRITAETYRLLNNRISLFTALPVQSLDRLSLQRRLADIG